MLWLILLILIIGLAIEGSTVCRVLLAVLLILFVLNLAGLNFHVQIFHHHPHFYRW